MRTLSPIESRVTAVGLAVAVGVLAWFVLVQWWFVSPLRRIDGRIQSLRQEQQRYVGIVAEGDALRARKASLATSRVDVGAFLTGNDANAATAALMQHAVDIVTAHASLGHCTVTQKMPMPSPAAAGSPFRKVSATINMRCDPAPLAAVLYDVAHGQPYVVIDTFNAYRNPQQGADGTLQPLNIQMTLSGYLRNHTGEPTQ